MLDRTVVPKFSSPEFKSFTSPINLRLNNGIQLSSFNSGDQEVFKIELIFPVGTCISSNPAVPSLCLEMLREGSKTKTAREINNTLDYYGAFLNFNSGIDNTIITLFGRSVFIKHLIPLLAEIISDPVFDENALNKHKVKMNQALLINEEKTSYWAPRLLRKLIFGEVHPYSKLMSSEAIEKITRDDIVGYHENSLSRSLKNIIVAGSYNEGEVNQLLNSSFQGFTLDFKAKNITPPKEGLFKAETKELGNTSQASIAIGKPTMGNTQENYADYAFMTKLFGGYFGSRLMKKLREEEGLTYGIHAFNNQLRGGSYLQISADVELNSVDKSIELILAEIGKLKQEDISLHEIDTVKNYMIGEYVNDSNTVFDFAELYKKLLLQRLPEDYYEIFYKRISDIDPEAVKSMAIETLDVDHLSIIKVY
jgi:zinc protease